MSERILSEVARLMRQIELEQEAAERALHSPAAGTARHDFITQKMERIGEHHQVLKGLVGEEKAIALVAEAIQGGPLGGQA